METKLMKDGHLSYGEAKEIKKSTISHSEKVKKTNAVKSRMGRSIFEEAKKTGKAFSEKAKKIKAGNIKQDMGKTAEKLREATAKSGGFKSKLKDVFRKLRCLLIKHPKKFLVKAGIVGLIAYGLAKAAQHYCPDTMKKINPMNSVADLISGGKDIKKEYDWDNNGLVEGDEQKAYKMRLEHDELVAQGKAKAKYTEYDVNKDGQVDDVEKEMRTKSYEMRLEQFNEDMKKLGINPQGELNEKQKAVVETAKEVYGIK